MNTQSNSTGMRPATGLKTAALVVLVGLIALAAQPAALSGHSATLPATTLEAPATGVSGTTGDAQYFAARYPAPTNVEDQPPTF
jgi:hypothetical protein